MFVVRRVREWARVVRRVGGEGERRGERDV